MKRPVILISVAVLLIGTAAIAGSFVPKTNTRAAVQAYVEEAAKVVHTKGAAACTTLATNDWRAGDYYIFVSGPDGKVLCHPSPEMIGKLQNDITNAKGDRVGEKVTKMSMADGKGWVDYLWKRPGKSAEEMKSSYVMGVTGPDGKHYTVGAGAWDLKK